MSEEEKKAIEYLKENSIPILRYDNYGNILNPLYFGTEEKQIIINLIDKQQKELEQVRKFGIPIETLCAEFERLENLEDKTDELKMELEDKQKEIEKYEQQIDLEFVEKNFIEKNKVVSKNKIKEIIKHYNNELEHIKNGEEFENEEPMYYWGKVALEDLLEENANE